MAANPDDGGQPNGEPTESQEGERQAGLGDLKLGRLPRDEAVVMEARTVAESILDEDPDLQHHAQLRQEVEDLLGDAVEFLFKS